MLIDVPQDIDLDWVSIIFSIDESTMVKQRKVLMDIQTRPMTIGSDSHDQTKNGAYQPSLQSAICSFEW